MKLATFSFDDGGPADFAVADLFRSHGLVPTFYIASAPNSTYFEKTFKA